MTDEVGWKYNVEILYQMVEEPAHHSYESSGTGQTVDDAS
jgi:hypothetical protein